MSASSRALRSDGDKHPLTQESCGSSLPIGHTQLEAAPVLPYRLGTS